MIITNLLTNMVVLAMSGDFVPSNPPAFQQYTFQVMLTNAQSLGKRWHLDEGVITSNEITDFRARAQPRQFHGRIEFAERYVFATREGGFLAFDDLQFRETATFPEWLTNQVVFERYGGDLKKWLQVTNSLSLEAAQALANSAMQAYGVRATEMQFHEPQRSEQLKIAERPLPFFKFRWENEKGHCEVHVSGLNSNIVFFEFAGDETLRLKPPENYLELLGLSQDTIFVRKRSSNTFELYESRPAR